MDAECLVVVDQARPDLYTWLRRRLGARAHVMLDRRGGRQPLRTDDRRQPKTVAEASLWNTRGYRVIFRRTGPRGEETSVRAVVYALAVAANLSTATAPRRG